MEYGKFAFLYDRLMKHAPYDKWNEFTKEMIANYFPKARAILDVGCGTGELLLHLKEAGFDAVGVDISADMLTVAQEKLASRRFHVPLFQQDMRDLDGLGPFDVITVYCDSLNYLKDEAEVFEAFFSILSAVARGRFIAV